MMTVIRGAAISIGALIFVNVGCATSSYKHFEHSDREVMTAMLAAQEAALIRLQASPSVDVAEAAREIAREVATR